MSRARRSADRRSDARRLPRPRAILVGAAPLPRGWLKRELARLGAGASVDLVIGVDGGVDACLRAGVRPGFAVGDWDSLRSRRALERIPHATLERAKDRSDLFFAIEAARLAGARELVALGVTGGRPDQHLATLLELAQAAREGFDSVRACSPEASYFWTSPATGPLALKGHARGTRVSVFAVLGDARGLALRGLEYSGRVKLLEPSSHGLSNRIEGGEVRIACREGVALAVLPR